MHKLKAAARHSAWYREEGDDAPNYNPFQKIHSRIRRRSNGEVERGTGTNLSNKISSSRVRNGTFHSEYPATSDPDDVSGAPPSPNHPQLMSANMHGAKRTEDLDKEVADTDRNNTSHDSGVDSGETFVGEGSANTSGSLKQRRTGVLAKLHLSKPKEDTAGLRSFKTNSSNSKPHFTLGNQIRGTLFNSWINVLLIMVPVGIAVNYAKIDPVAIFVINFIAIIPLAAMLSYATEEIALRTGETLGGLLNATFGNAVELIVSIIALAANQILIVQTSLIGSMLSNLLLVMGMCFFFGGLKRLEQHFNVTVAQTASSLLALAIASLIIPTAFALWAPGGETATQGKVTDLSRGTSILLLLVYAAYLYFQLGTHATIYNEPSQKVAKRSSKHAKGEAEINIAAIGAGLTSVGGEAEQRPNSQDNGEDDTEEPKLHIWVAVATLAVSTVFVALCAEFMVDSIDALTDSGAISKTFVGLILLPIVGNAAEHATAVTVACKDKMDLAIGVAVGSSMQIALLVLPLVVVLGWILDKPMMDLSFDGFQIAVLFVAVLLVNYLITDGKSHWLEGLLLQTLYLIIAIAAWYYPNTADQDGS